MIVAALLGLAGAAPCGVTGPRQSGWGIGRRFVPASSWSM
jgi:hypothetical protein